MSEQTMVTHPGTAAVLSFIFNGLGQIYNGQIKKGLLIIFLSAISMLIFLLGSLLIAFWILGMIIFAKELIFGFISFSLGLVFICILGIYSIFDAYNAALKK